MLELGVTMLTVAGGDLDTRSRALEVGHVR